MTRPPDEREARLYYHGVGGLLVARTSTFDYEPKEREFRVIGDHDIIGIWSNELALTLHAALEDSKINWVRFYPIRLGYRDGYNGPGYNGPNHDGPSYNDPNHNGPDYDGPDYDGPGSGPESQVILMIEIDKSTGPLTPTWLPSPPDSGDDWNIQWSDHSKAAFRCRELLNGAGVSDIEVEIRALERAPFALDARLEKAVKERAWERDGISHMYLRSFTWEKLMPALSYLGYEISSPDMPNIRGSMGLHVRLSGRPSEFYGLTCRHVAVPLVGLDRKAQIKAWILDREGYHFGNASSSVKHNVIQLRDSTRAGLVRSDELSEAKAEQRKLRHKRYRHFRDPKTHPDLNEKESKVLDLLDKDIPFAENLMKIMESCEFIEDRFLGYIAEMPPDEISPRGFVRDWALIRLDEDKFSQPPTNRVFVTHDKESIGLPFEHLPLAEKNEWWALRNTCKEEEPNDSASTIRLHGSVPGDEILHRRSFGVAKFGAASKLTVGRTNEIEAILRSPSAWATTGKPAWEWIVVKDANDGKERFSQPGDSGSAVFDCKGRVLGLIISGQAYKGQDISCVCPIHLLLEDIEKETGCTVEIV